MANDQQSPSEACRFCAVASLGSEQDQDVGLIANSSSGAAALPTWDRVSFTIRLEDHAYKLQDRTLWLVGRYSTGEGGSERWDNNLGRNHKVAFNVVPAKRREDTGRTLSAPGTLSLPFAL